MGVREPVPVGRVVGVSMVGVAPSPIATFNVHEQLSQRGVIGTIAMLMKVSP